MGNSTTIALESQKIIYTGFIKYDYKWTFFSNTIVVGYLIGDNKYNIIYLDIENNAKLCKNINNLLGIISNDSFCILLIENKDNVYNIIFTNNFGNLLDNKKCPIKPLIYTINNEYLVISDGDYIYILIFRYNSLNKKNINDKSNSNIIIGKNVFNNNKLDNKLMKELIFFIDDENIDINNNEYNYNTFKENNNNKLTNDKIIYMSLSINYLFIARSFGEVYQYDISTLKLEKKFRFEEKIKKFGISPFETYLWTIDKNDILRLHNIKYQEKDEEKNKKIKDFFQ